MEKKSSSLLTAQKCLEGSKQDRRACTTLREARHFFNFKIEQLERIWCRKRNIIGAFFHVYVYVILIDFCGLKFNVSFIFIKSYKKGQSCSNIYFFFYKIYDTKQKKKPEKSKPKTTLTPAPPKKTHQNKHNSLFQLMIFIACFSLQLR